MTHHYPVGQIEGVGQIIAELRIAGDRMSLQAAVMKDWSERFYAFAAALDEARTSYPHASAMPSVGK